MFNWTVLSNIHILVQIEHKSEVMVVYSLDAELTRPLWVFGNNSYDFVQKNGQSDLLACSYRSPVFQKLLYLSLFMFFFVRVFHFGIFLNVFFTGRMGSLILELLMKFRIL